MYMAHFYLHTLFTEEMPRQRNIKAIDLLRLRGPVVSYELLRRMSSFSSLFCVIGYILQDNNGLSFKYPPSDLNDFKFVRIFVLALYFNLS